MDQGSATLREKTITWEDPHATAAATRIMAGIDYFRAVMRGELPPPPIARLLGYTWVEAEPGRIVMALVPAEQHYNPIGMVHGGVAATLLDSVMGCSVHSMLPLGKAYTTLEIKVNYLAAMTVKTGEVRAEGKTVHVGRSTAMAEGRILDAKGKLYAAATTTCLIFDAPPAN
jgi:uncharacterized protein (TIGR00369 family)